MSGMTSLVGPPRRTLAKLDRGRRAFLERLLGVGRDRFGGVSRTGAAFAVLFYWGSLTPSLLPRPWYLQGVIAAICATLGYAVGVAMGATTALVGRVLGLEIRIREGAAQAMRRLWLLVVAIAVIAFPFRSLEWQQANSRYAGVPQPGRSWVVLSTIVAVLVFWLFLAIWRAIAGLFDWLTVRLGNRRFLRESISRVVASVLTVLIVTVLVDQVVLRGGLAVATRAANQVNQTPPVGRSAPSSSYRSGGPGSSQPWESLGQDGAIFVSGGPNAADIRGVTGRAAKEPIRVFAGVARNPTMERARDAVLAEMDRTGAWGRRSILLVSATSTGYVNEWSVSSFEYLQDGDTAIASLQYSDLPSALGLLTAPHDPPRAFRMLLDAVRTRLSALPAGARPRLYVGGESLGAYGGNGAFASPEEMRAQVDGALWTGTPSFTALHQELTGRRTAGSGEANPVLGNGRAYRFADGAEELWADRWGRPLGTTWDGPRVVYLQHRSDPVSWWSPRLLVETPAWLAETRGDDPAGQMGWLPLVTFWQVTADMAMSNNVPTGRGHRYGAEETVPAWAAILGLVDPGPTGAPVMRGGPSAAGGIDLAAVVAKIRSVEG